MVDEALDVLRRIREEKPDLMGEFAALAESADEVCDAASAVAAIVARVVQDLGRLFVLQISPQLRGAVQVQKDLSFQKTDRQQTQALWHKQTVQAADVRKKRFLIFARTREEAARFDTCQRRRTLPHQDLFRHACFPPLWFRWWLPRS